MIANKVVWMGDQPGFLMFVFIFFSYIGFHSAPNDIALLKLIYPVKEHFRVIKLCDEQKAQDTLLGKSYKNFRLLLLPKFFPRNWPHDTSDFHLMISLTYDSFLKVRKTQIIVSKMQFFRDLFKNLSLSFTKILYTQIKIGNKITC